MSDAEDLAGLAALLGDPARARIVTALMRGTAMTATELAWEAEVAPSTASAHLARLAEARILVVEKQGRHRYYRLADVEVAETLESMTGVAARRRNPLRTGPASPALRASRVCYDHLAGERGVGMLDSLLQSGTLTGREALSVSDAGVVFFGTFGIDVEALGRGRRPLCRTCIDWSERRDHLGGALGAAILQRIFALGWAARERDDRAVVFSATGEREFRRCFAGGR